MICLCCRALEDRGIAGRLDRDGHLRGCLSSLGRNSVDVMGYRMVGLLPGEKLPALPQGLATALHVCSYSHVTFLPSNVPRCSICPRTTGTSCRNLLFSHSPVFFHILLTPSVIIFSQNKNSRLSSCLSPRLKEPLPVHSDLQPQGPLLGHPGQLQWPFLCPPLLSVLCRCASRLS